MAGRPSIPTEDTILKTIQKRNCTRAEAERYLAEQAQKRKDRYNSKNKGADVTMAKKTDNNDMSNMSIEELEALAESKYKEWESAPFGIEKANLKEELAEVSKRLEDARNAVNNNVGFTPAQLTSIINKAITDALSQVSFGNDELLKEIKSLREESKKRTLENAELQDEIEELKREHAKQLAELRKQLDTLQNTIEIVGSDVKKKSKAKATSSVSESDDDYYVFKVSKKGKRSDISKQLADVSEKAKRISEEEANTDIVEQFRSAADGWNSNAENTTLATNDWNELDEKGQAEFLAELKKYEGMDNAVYECIRANVEVINESVARYIRFYDGLVDNSHENAEIGDSEDVEDFDEEDIFKD